MKTADVEIECRDRMRCQIPWVSVRFGTYVSGGRVSGVETGSDRCLEYYLPIGAYIAL